MVSEQNTEHIKWAVININTKKKRLVKCKKK